MTVVMVAADLCLWGIPSRQWFSHRELDSWDVQMGQPPGGKVTAAHGPLPVNTVWGVLEFPADNGMFRWQTWGAMKNDDRTRECAFAFPSLGVCISWAHTTYNEAGASELVQFFSFSFF